MDSRLPADEYTGETIAAMIAVPLVITGFVALTVFAFLRWRATDHTYDDEGPLWLTGGITTGVCAALTGALLWWGMYPWKAEYHQWRAVTGTVASVDSRLTSTSQGGMEDKYVVTFEGNDQEYGVLDTRAAAVKPGDTLTITCVRRWQWSGSHGFDCNFVDFTRKYPR